jgi:hypothetical protein
MDERTSSSISAIIAWVCIAAYVVALVVAGIQIGFNIKDRQIAAEREFSGLVNSCSRISAQAFMNKAFQDTIQDALTYSDTLQGIILAGPDGEYAFERALSGAIDRVENSPRFAKQFGTSSRMFFSPLDVEGLRNVTLSAVYRYIDFDLLLSVLKRTLIIVLAALTIAFFALILESVTDKRHLGETEGESPYSSSSYSSAGEGEPEAVPEKPVQKTRRPSPLETTAPRETMAPSETMAPLDQDLDQDLDSLFNDDSFDEVFGSDDNDTPLSGDFPGIVPDAEDDVSFGEDAANAGPAGEPGVIGREEDAPERLDAELRRSESSGEDLTVMVLEYGNPDDPEGIWFRDFVRMTVDYFDSGVTIFGKGKTGMTVILTDTDINGGIGKVKEFRNRIPAAFTRKLAVGLSSRLGRFVKADRILLEAAEASAKSKKDPENRIVAFKSDLDKYRAFIEKKSVQ